MAVLVVERFQTYLASLMEALKREQRWEALEGFFLATKHIFPNWFPGYTYYQAACAELADYWADRVQEDPINQEYVMKLLMATKNFCQANRDVRRVSDMLEKASLPQSLYHNAMNEVAQRHEAELAHRFLESMWCGGNDGPMSDWYGKRQWPRIREQMLAC